MRAVAKAAPAAEIDQSSPFVSAAHIDAMCDPLTQPAAQIRYLKGLGLNVATRPNGRPLLMKSELERVLGGRQNEAQPQAPGVIAPNITGLVELFNRRKTHGKSGSGR